MSMLILVKEQAYNVDTCLKTLLTSGTRSRQQSGFFTSPDITSSDAAGQNYKTRKGNTARSASYEFSMRASPSQLENWLEILKDSTRSIHMPKFEQGALASAIRIPTRVFRFIASCIRLRSISAAIWIDAYDNTEAK